jgi:hypothetical protein
VTLLSWLACLSNEPTPEPEPEPSAAAEPTEIDRLRALGYLDAAEADEAEPSGVLIHDERRSQPGYNLYASRSLSRADLIDADGEVVHSWADTVPGKWLRVELQPDGSLLVVARDLGENRSVLQISWSGDVLWRSPINAHHDLTLTPEGELIALDYQLRDLPELQAGTAVRDDHLTWLSADGAPIRTRSLTQMLMSRPDLVTLRPVRPSVQAGIEQVDLLHANALHFLAPSDQEGAIYEAGNLLMTARHQDLVFILDLDEGEPVWAWGPGVIQGPHDPSMLQSGHVLLFDNGLGRGYSRVLEVDPRSDTIVWEYKAETPTDFYTASRGSAQRLDNGNTLIAQSDAARAFEVTPAGEIVWEFVNPNLQAEDRRATFNRMERLPASLVEPLLAQGGP